MYCTLTHFSQPIYLGLDVCLAWLGIEGQLRWGLAYLPAKTEGSETSTPLAIVVLCAIELTPQC
jgi:hypothetical protein